MHHKYIVLLHDESFVSVIHELSSAQQIALDVCLLFGYKYHATGHGEAIFKQGNFIVGGLYTEAY